MTAMLSGKELAASIRQEVADRAEQLTNRGVQARLAVVSATDDEGSAWYVRSIAAAARKAGIACTVVDVEKPDAIRETLESLSTDPSVHGIILQTPLPEGADRDELATAIDPSKDVDGANPASLGRIAAGLPAFAPATAEAVVALLEFHQVELEGRHAVVVGRSTVVGKPLAHLLLDRDATVTMCHSRTRTLPEITRQADVLVAAVGKPGLLTQEHVRRGAVVIDVGTNPTPDGGLVGDVHAESVLEHAAALTPVPGGVGPVTTAILLRHTVSAAS